MFIRKPTSLPLCMDPLPLNGVLRNLNSPRRVPLPHHLEEAQDGIARLQEFAIQDCLHSSSTRMTSERAPVPQPSMLFSGLQARGKSP